MVPATRLPPAVTVNAFAVLAWSIDSVKRTDRSEARSIFWLLSNGRNRTTVGASTVDTVTEGAVANGTPSASTRPASEMR